MRGRPFVPPLPDFIVFQANTAYIAFMGLTFDTLAYSKRLEAKGFTNQQAEALAEEQAALIRDQLATKLDIEEIRHDLKKLEASLKRDMKELEASLKRDMKELELRLKHDLTLRMGGMLAVAVGILAALMQIL